jgi:hypothetical protein
MRRLTAHAGYAPAAMRGTQKGKGQLFTIVGQIAPGASVFLELRVKQHHAAYGSGSGTVSLAFRYRGEHVPRALPRLQWQPLLRPKAPKGEAVEIHRRVQGFQSAMPRSAAVTPRNRLIRSRRQGRHGDVTRPGLIFPFAHFRSNKWLFPPTAGTIWLSPN